MDIMKWRNDQMYHLRQTKRLTKKSQDEYFETVVSSLFSSKRPTQLLFSFLKNNICIGYGGLVHINWTDKNAEISLVLNTSITEQEFTHFWMTFLHLIEEVAFLEVKFHKIFTYGYEFRTNVFQILEAYGFTKDAELTDHCLFESNFINVILHSLINKTNLIEKTDGR